MIRLMKGATGRYPEQLGDNDQLHEGRGICESK